MRSLVLCVGGSRALFGQCACFVPVLYASTSFTDQIKSGCGSEPHSRAAECGRAVKGRDRD